MDIDFENDIIMDSLDNTFDLDILYNNIFDKKEEEKSKQIVTNYVIKTEVVKEEVYIYIDMYDESKYKKRTVSENTLLVKEPKKGSMIYNILNEDDIFYIAGEVINGDYYLVKINKDDEDFAFIEKDKPIKIPKKSKSSNNSNNNKLSAYSGVCYGPSGKETYYNLNMSRIVNSMKSKEEYKDWEYWIRDDGCKMFGDYIMVAANLNLRPKGTIVETSLGKGIVVDTGGFAVNNPEQLDIACNW